MAGIGSKISQNEIYWKIFMITDFSILICFSERQITNERQIRSPVV